MAFGHWTIEVVWSICNSPSHDSEESVKGATLAASLEEITNSQSVLLVFRLCDVNAKLYNELAVKADYFAIMTHYTHVDE